MGRWDRVVARSHAERQHHLSLLSAAGGVYGRRRRDTNRNDPRPCVGLREGGVGLLIGGIVGLSAGACLLAWGGARSVAFTLAVTLALTAMIATFVASLLPIGLSRMGVDPALESGPVATVVQDILSVAVYLGIATLIL